MRNTLFALVLGGACLLQASLWATDSAAGIVFSEIMYHPIDATNTPLDGDEYEFLEVFNTGSGSVDLSGAYFSSGITYTFPSGTSLSANHYVVVVKNRTAFFARYPGAGNVAPSNFTGNLSNNGEKITLKNSGGGTLYSATYGTSGAWPDWPDGKGCSLVLHDPLGAADMPDTWRASADFNGTPGATGQSAYVDIVINEILAHTDPPQEDAIELYNSTSNAIDISDWYISDQNEIRNKYRITNTIIAAHGYVVLYEYQFNTNSLFNSNNIPFALSSWQGDQVFLTAADAASNLTRQVDCVSFGASENGVSFGRYPDGLGDLIPMEKATLGVTNPPSVEWFRTGRGAANGAPKIGPVVISEIMYHPTNDAVAGEYVELLNTSTNPVQLFDPQYPTNTWKLTTAIEYTFPTNLSLAPESRLLVIGTASTAWFRAAYAVPPEVLILGPWTGRLDNAGESIRLMKPDTPNPEDGFVPYVLVDRVDYRDAPPWPLAADGKGPSLEKLVATNYGNWADNWIGGIPGGTPGRSLPIGLVNAQAWPSTPVAGQSITVTVSVISQVAPTSVVMQTSANGSVTTNVMRDDGLLGDAVEGDRVYSAVVPGQADGTWVYYSLIAYITNGTAITMTGSGGAGWSWILVGTEPPGVVINEIMYHNDRTNDESYEYIELYNAGTNAETISAWKLDGVRFSIPTGTVLQAHGYLVCCADTNAVIDMYGCTNVVGNWSGILQNDGETIALFNSFGRTVDCVAYKDNEPWPAAADGEGPSLERINPLVNDDTFRNWSSSMAETNWQHLIWTSRVDNIARGLCLYLNFEGKCQVDDVSVTPEGGGAELVVNGGFETGTNGWYCLGNHSQSRVENGMGRNGSAAMVLVGNESRRIEEQMNWWENTIILSYGEAESNAVCSPPFLPFSGSNYVISCWIRRAGLGDQFVAALGETTNSIWLSCQGTPGSRNNMVDTRCPLAIGQVWQEYNICPTGKVNVIRAIVSPTGMIASVKLHYRVMGNNDYRFADCGYSNLTMYDDGALPDTIPGDGEYAVYGPTVSESNHIVRYHVEITGTNEMTAQSPRRDDPSRDYGYWVFTGSRQTILPNWHIFGDGNPVVYPISRFACAVDPEGHVFTDIRMRMRGGPNLDDPSDDLFNGIALRVHPGRQIDTWFAKNQDGINFRHRTNTVSWHYRYLINEPLAYHVQRTIGFPAPRTRFVCVWIDGAPTVTEELEDPGEAFLPGNDISTDNFVARNGWPGRSVVGGDRKLDNIVDVWNALEAVEGPELENVVRSNLCYDSILYSMALVSIVANRDQHFEWNMFHERRASDGRWRTYPWDVDASFDMLPTLPTTNMHPYYQTSLHPNIVNPDAYSLLGKILFDPESGLNANYTLPYRHRQQAALWRYCHTLFTTNYLYPRIDALQGQLAPALQQIGVQLTRLTNSASLAKSFIRLRRDFLMHGDWSDKETNLWADTHIYNPFTVMINEIMPQPLTGGEYVELYNRGTDPVDLSWWTIVIGNDRYRIPHGTMIGPDDYLVIVDKAREITNSFAELRQPSRIAERYPGQGIWDWPMVWTGATEYATRIVEIPKVGLPDVGATIQLIDTLSNLVDQVMYSNAPPWNYIAGSSLELTDPLADNAASSSGSPSTKTGTPCLVNSVAFDRDDDHMADAWERRLIEASAGRYSAITQIAWADDFDGDGLCNGDEFMAGTDPARNDGLGFSARIEKSNGYLRVSIPTFETTGSVYRYYQNRLYTLQTNTAPSGVSDWHTIPEFQDRIGAGQTLVYTNSAKSVSACFFRFFVRLTPW